MFASMLSLTKADIMALRITDMYSLHRVIYDLFEDVRSDEQKKTSIPSGILYLDKGGDWNSRNILILSDRQPKTVQYGKVVSKTVPHSFLLHDQYSFEVTVNPTKRDSKTGKTVAIIGVETIKQWFIKKTIELYGFEIEPDSLEVTDIAVNFFKKSNHEITQNSARIIGQLKVVDRKKFIKGFQQGIGRGKAFGFGLLQINPILK